MHTVNGGICSQMQFADADLHEILCTQLRNKESISVFKCLHTYTLFISHLGIEMPLEKPKSWK